MKKHAIILFLFLILSSNVFGEQGNYSSGNGTIINQTIDDNISWVIRKHNQRVQIGDLAEKENLSIYDSYSSAGILIGELKMGDYINIYKIAEAKKNDHYYVWLNISTDNKVSGWIFFNKNLYESAQFCDPYFNNRWEILRSIKNGKSWTIRKMIYQLVTVWEVLNIRDKPGIIGSYVISKIIPSPNGNPQINLNVLETTEETETIDGKNDRWLKINYNGIKGWIFGGYVSVERGGPKYYTPENIIDFGLGFE